MARLPVEQTLKKADLKMSLVQLKVIDVLWEASGEQGRAPIRALHRHLSEAGTPLSLVSIRQVLRRLVESDLAILDEQDVYSPGKTSWDGTTGSTVPGRRAAADEQRL